MSFENPSSLEQTRELLIQQKIGAAKVLARIDQIIMDNVDIDQEKVNSAIEEVSSEYQISPEQIDLINKGMAHFFEKHQAVVDAITKFKKNYGDNWKTEFYNYCFGQYPSGDVDLREGPITIYWLCENLNDYAIACNEDPDTAQGSFGQRKSLLDEQPDELRGTIIVEWTGHPEHHKNSLNQQKEKSKTTEIHEQQHIIFDMLADELDYSPLNFDGLGERSNLEEVQKATRKYLSFRRLEMERSAKNEIIAYWRDGEKTLNEIKSIILEKGGIYDHRNDTNEKQLAKYLVSRFGEKYKEFIPNLNIDNIWQEECKIFMNSINQAFQVLQEIDKQSSDKKRDYLYLLSLERTDKWRRTYDLCRDKI